MLWIVVLDQGYEVSTYIVRAKSGDEAKQKVLEMWMLTYGIDVPATEFSAKEMKADANGIALASQHQNFGVDD